MEPQISINCRRQRNSSCYCLLILIFLLAFLLAFAVGVLIGGVTGLFSVIGLGAFIVLITLLVTFLIGLIIYYLCIRCRRGFCRG